MIDNERERYWERTLKETAHVIVTDIGNLRKKRDVLVICGQHNKVLAQNIMLEAQRIGAHPFLWEFSEDFFRDSFENISGTQLNAILGQAHSLVKKSDAIVWLSQFEDIERFPAHARKAIYSFWDAIDEAVKPKPSLFVNLPSRKTVRAMGINYLEFFAAFVNGVKIDYSIIEETGLKVASGLSGKKLIRVYNPNGTNLEFNIEGRHVSVESGTLENCYSTGKNCGIDVPAGEVYVAPVENSANGILVVNEHKGHGLRKLQLRFADGRISDFKAEKGEGSFKRLLEEAKGNKDRIGEFGIGINYGMKTVGWSVYDEKALGTAHIAIGNNTHLGGVNEASIHVDFVLDKPTVEADDMVIIRRGKLVKQRKPRRSKYTL